MRISDWSSDVCSSDLLRFAPGLVGGHCIGVDPYYLSYKAQQLGMLPRVVLAGRSINDGMSNYLADEVHSRLGKAGRVLMLGLTFKEDVPDLRNSKVVNRSEEHTSELQSLMRISYAVFC